MKHTLTEIVKQTAVFQCLRVGTAYYRITMPSGVVYDFYVPRAVPDTKYT